MVCFVYDVFVEGYVVGWFDFILMFDICKGLIEVGVSVIDVWCIFNVDFMCFKSLIGVVLFNGDF